MTGNDSLVVCDILKLPFHRHSRLVSTSSLILYFANYFITLENCSKALLSFPLGEKALLPNSRKCLDCSADSLNEFAFFEMENASSIAAFRRNSLAD